MRRVLSQRFERTFRQGSTSKMAPFEKSVVHWIQLHVLNDPRITGRAMYTRERHIASVVELFLLLFLARSTTFTRQHVQHHQNMMEGLTVRVLKDTTITKRQLDLVARKMLERASLLSNGDEKSRQYFNFRWIALTAQLSQPPRSSQCVSDPCIVKRTTH